MPIRTHRGRAAVYRRFWGWPLRSPRHLLGTLLVLVVLVVAIGVGVPKLVGSSGDSGGDAAPRGGQGQTGQAGSTPTSRSSRAQPAPPQTRLSEPLRSPTSAPASPDALRVAKQWASAWVNHPDGVSSEEWLRGLRPYTTAEYLPVMSSVDPANIPASEVTGEPVADKSFTSSVEALVSTDGPKLRITVIRTDAGWRVADYEQAA